jgi:hypothetical protein
MSGSLIARDCLFYDNRAAIGGAVSQRGTGDVLWENCTIYGNHAHSAGGVRVSSAEFRNCVFWANEPTQVVAEDSASIYYSVVEGGAPGVGNSSDPPLLQRSWRGLVWSPLPASPCVDGGDPELLDAVSDWHPRWPAGFADSPRSDIGAYGGPLNYLWSSFIERDGGGGRELRARHAPLRHRPGRPEANDEVAVAGQRAIAVRRPAVSSVEVPAPASHQPFAARR